MLEKFGTLLGQYMLGTYYYGLRLACSFLRIKLPENLKPVAKELKSINELANELELSAFEFEDDKERGGC